MIDKSDLKYIIRRIIVFLIMSIIFFVCGSCNAKAETISFGYNNFYNTGTYITNTQLYSLNMWNSVKTKTANKKGNLVFTLYQAPINAGAELINSVEVWDSTNSFNCNLGNQLYYIDNANYRAFTTVVCPVDFDSSGMQSILLHRPSAADSTYILFSEHMTLTDNDEAAVQSLNTQLNDIYNKLNTGFSDLYNMTNQQFNIISGQLTTIYNLMTTQNQNITTAINNASNQAHTDAQAINNSLNDESAPTNNDISGNTSQWSSMNTSNNTITQLLTMPLTLINAYLNGINGTCSSFNLGSLYGTDLVLPCINVSNFIGTALWSTIDILFSGFMIFNIGRKLIKIFNDFTNLNSNQVDELYGGGA